MYLNLVVVSPDDLPDHWKEVIEREHGPGSLDDVDFVVYWRKYKDDEENGMKWDGWPFRRDVGSIYRVDDPDNWKDTWFLFTH